MNPQAGQSTTTMGRKKTKWGSLTYDQRLEWCLRKILQYKKVIDKLTKTADDMTEHTHTEGGGPVIVRGLRSRYDIMPVLGSWYNDDYIGIPDEVKVDF